MKRKNLIAKRKVKSKNLLYSDPQIQNFYKKFKSIIYKDIRNKSFALAVSGGPDSLCLAYFSKIYSLEFGNKIHILIVDHRLRKESRDEALKVRNLLRSKKITSKILSWKGKTPKNNVQKKARDIRYSLISNYCINKKVNFLVTAHHGDDQIENFFIRLFRGSGLSGLSSMSSKTEYSKNLKIIRPFLNLNKSNLKYATLKHFKTYFKDPSNENEKFLRVRIRKYRTNMEKEGLDTNKIKKTVDNLLIAKKALDFYKNKALYKHASFLSKNKCLINKKVFSEEAGEIIFKFFSDIFSLVSETYYPPRSKKVINLIYRIKKKNFIKSTLGGCIIEEKENFILISKEPKVRKASYQLQR